jgi:hypothetical protein
MTFLESTWYNTDKLESLLLKIFNEESEDALMIRTYIKQIFSTFTFALLLLLSLKFISYFFRCY